MYVYVYTHQWILAKPLMDQLEAEAEVNPTCAARVATL